ncbi:succinate--CoA ligase subunit alpha [Candidatus Bathyarchaeota archaeon]|nr:MAG: succinate--CoA ligase subunit alpha [Candidatus Bathyarchaeota archaeon]RLI16697.1 MAG: succinate--CoA ligase subunit alpha [Candidatus Bathyarchaeota archaeon]
MVRFVDGETRVLVQGITGRQGRFHTKLMLEYGTRIVAGVTPGKGGESVEGVPVYDTVAEAMDRHRIDASIIFVPAPYAPDAVYEALDAGLDPIVVITEGIAVRDTMMFVAKARRSGVTIIGPNTPGVIKVGECKLGIMPASVFKRGRVGVISRSGTLTYEIADHISSIGLGESTCVGLGGDPITGLDFIDVLKWFEDDPETEAVVLIGEIGGDAEERAAEFIAEGGFTKPAVAYIAGRTAIPGKRMGHAGAIIQGERGTAKSKIEALEAAGVPVAEKPRDVAKLLKELLS